MMPVINFQKNKYTGGMFLFVFAFWSIWTVKSRFSRWQVMLQVLKTQILKLDDYINAKIIVSSRTKFQIQSVFMKSYSYVHWDCSSTKWNWKTKFLVKLFALEWQHRMINSIFLYLIIPWNLKKIYLNGLKRVATTMCVYNFLIYKKHKSSLI